MFTCCCVDLPECWDMCQAWPSTVEAYFPAGMFSNKAFTPTGADDWFCNGGCTVLNDQTYVLNMHDGSPGWLCPEWIYVEPLFCDVDNPEGVGGGPYPATLTIKARAYNQRFWLSVAIESECVQCNFGAGHAPLLHHGSLTYYSFRSPFHAYGSNCVELDHEMSWWNDPDTATPDGTGQFCRSSEDSFLAGVCIEGSPACSFNATKKPVLYLP